MGKRICFLLIAVMVMVFNGAYDAYSKFTDEIVIVSTTTVPTLSEWGMIILAILLGIEAVYYVRRRIAA